MLQRHHEYSTASSSERELDALKTFARHGLGKDSSSDHFLARQKAIAFVYVDKSEIFRLDQNYFIQNSTYNDFSGGYKRFYKLIPQKIIKGAAKQEILNFQRHNGIPDKTIMLVQIQSSFALAAASSPERDEVVVRKRSNSVTGQGIHTDDGTCHGMLLCLERTNVLGAENSFFEDLSGERRLGNPTVLEAGDLVYFCDDKIYHYVSPAQRADSSAPMRRSIMLIHFPARMFLTGEKNENNSLRTIEVPKERKLRLSFSKNDSSEYAKSEDDVW